MGRVWLWSAVAVALATTTVQVLAAGGDYALAGPGVAGRTVTVVAGVGLVLLAGLLPVAAPGRLWLAAAGAAWLAADWANPLAPTPLVFSIGLLSAGAAVPLLLAGVVDRPGPRAWRRVWWAAVAVAAAGAVVSGAVAALLADPRAHGCPDCPADLLALGLLRSVDPAAVARLGAVLALAGCVGMLPLVVRAARRADAAALVRGVVDCVVVASLAVEAAVVAAAGPGTAPATRAHVATSLALVVLVAHRLSWAVRARLALRALVRAMESLDRPGAAVSVEELLRTALQDPRLRVLYPVADGWYDARGRRAGALPETAALLADGADTLAAVVPGEDRQSDLVATRHVLGGTRLLLDVERLEVAERVRADQLAAARELVVGASAAARVRLERDLHDGAQQHLVALRYALGLALSRAQRVGAVEAVAALERSDAAAEQALVELRELAHGTQGRADAQAGAQDAVGSP